MKWQDVVVFFGRLGFWCYTRLFVIRVWSKIYQFVYERKKVLPLKRFDDIEDLVAYVHHLKWRADSWRELGDAISSPEAVQWLAENDPSHFIGDCDEFGVYQAAVVNNELAGNPSWSDLGIKEAHLLTITWLKTGGQVWVSNELGYGGHNVCLLSYNDGTYSYMDYSMPSERVATIELVAKQVLDKYAQEYVALGWAKSDPRSLKFLEGEWK